MLTLLVVVEGERYSIYLYRGYHFEKCQKSRCNTHDGKIELSSK